MKKKTLIIGGCLVLLLLGGIGVWNKLCSTTKVAFINFQTLQMGSLSKANDNSFIRLSELSPEEFDRLTDYDMVFVNGMGLRIVEEQRMQLQQAADKGIPIYTSMATNPANNICNLDSTRQKQIRAYLSNGGKRNYRSLLSYIRKEIDGKLISSPEPEKVIEKASDILYHAGVKNPEEEMEFVTVSEYEKFLHENGLYKEGAHKIVVTGQMADATDLIAALEKTGYTVYPVSSMRRFQTFLEEINPDAVINMAHGRLGDQVVDYLTAKNILLFSPLTINSLVEEWENDPMGMNGGFLSQSVVTPEIDGAIRPFALFAQYTDNEGIRHSFAIPERLETFVKTVDNYLSLKEKPNSEKRVAIYYYKGAGQNALTAGGMEVAPSLFNLLTRLKQEGYKVEGLPANSKELERMIQAQGAVFGAYAEGAFSEFMKTGKPALISKEEYETWIKQSLRPEKYAEVVAANGEFPGEYMTTPDGKLGVARVQFGNVVLLPQNAAGKGDNSFKVVHGTNAAPPHTYIASYLWMQHGFKADALIHFGTHGSLEFTPKKQVALCSNDWPDRLVGTVPHFYIYSIGNVGEAMMAKRRSYATLQSYLTPPFMESSVRGIYRELNEKIKIYNNKLGNCNCNDPEHATPKDTRTTEDLQRASLAVKAATVKLGIHRELGLDSLLNVPYTEEDILRIENFAEELATEKITGQLYTMGVPYEAERITSSLYAMATEPIAYSLLALDKLRGKADERTRKHRTLFTQQYLNPAHELVTRVIANPSIVSNELICRTAGITPQELETAHAIDAERNAPKGMMAMMMAGGKGSSKMNASRGKNKKEYSKEEVEKALAILEVERTVKNVGNYKNELQMSPEKELRSIINSLNGGYTIPSPGGDPIANPNTLPTGRNLYAINAEATPSESAWEKGIQLANQTINEYRRRHNDSIPRKVSYTLWSSEFIETGGATIAQVLYMLGVEPIRDAFGRVSDLRLIPSTELGRPRIDVVVQTSGQLRDLAASRLFLINRAVEMAANAKGDNYENLVAASVVEAERTLTDKGLSPKDAREMSTFRVFGGVNGGYGTGIQGMVQAGDRWENESEIADVYLNNMGAYYGNEKNWEAFRQFAFEAALTRTDVVIQPRQSNTWGALSLDHVYEFMGGMNLAVRNVTGKDPDAYFSDYRNRNNMRVQELKESIGIESRTTILNPAYIKEKMKGESSSASGFAEIVTNTYGWNVMKPAVIDKELWEDIYDVYVNDRFQLGVKEYFEKQNPAALEEMSAVMLETIRKGMWKASEAQITELTKLHTELVNKYRPSCSGFVCDNAKLREFIASKADAPTASQYKKNIATIREAQVDGDNKGVVMKKEEMNQPTEGQTNTLSNITVGVAVVLVVLALVIFIRRRKKI